MKFSEQWLKNHISIDVNVNDLTHKMTMSGLEVDSIKPVSSFFTGVFIGEVVTCLPHPNADKLKVTEVSIGTSEKFQVVCGASNVTLGMKVPFAILGAQLSNNFHIKKVKLRGIESYGMLCSASELGLSEISDGLLELPKNSPVGQDIRQYLKLDDFIIDVNLTPNRGDCLSIQGLAREVSANFSVDMNQFNFKNIDSVSKEVFPVIIKDKHSCPRFLTRIIRDVDINSTTPIWMIEALRRSDIRSINPIVDITSYVMLELGQPMHAYDCEKISGSIIVRKARDNENLVLLNDQEVILKSDTLVIADGQKILSIAGVMGGISSSVSSTTRDILLESAFFNPLSLAGKARNYGLHTDASHRFERGVDYQLQRKAIERSTQLILEICGGKASAVSETVSVDELPKRIEIELYYTNIVSMIGMHIDTNKVSQFLKFLGLEILSKSEDYWKVVIPTWRFDLHIEEDLIEEIVRLYGYDSLPKTTLQVPVKMHLQREKDYSEIDLKKHLASRSYHEVICFSFIDKKIQKLFSPSNEGASIINPISSDMSVMRTSLLPGLVKTMITNLNRKKTNIRLFEVGQVFDSIENQGFEQENIALLMTGSYLPDSWHNSQRPIDFYDLKGDIEQLMNIIGHTNIQFKKGYHEALHPNQCALITKNGQEIGILGSLHPSIKNNLGINQPVILFEADLKKVLQSDVSHAYEISRFPLVKRDLALLVKKDISASMVLDVIKKEVGDPLIDLYFFDIYEGEGIDKNYKSMTVSIKLQYLNKTLTDEETNKLIGKLMNNLSNTLEIKLRN